MEIDKQDGHTDAYASNLDKPKVDKVESENLQEVISLKTRVNCNVTLEFKT